MNVKIVFVDDAAFALQRLNERATINDEHWVLVACAPKITRRASRWGNRSTLEKWRNKWAKNLFEGLIPQSTQLQRARVSTHISEVSVQQMTAQLHAEYPEAEVLDWRRPKAISEPPSADFVPRPAKLAGSLLGILGICFSLVLDGA
ncbi:MULTISPECIES: hypothetical protein [Comamonas]|uniref:Uncharacterized protein n=1 Tax=Comamonas koreensis TaxID=160825 RepID=A0AAW4Y1J3_9BURK|nr:MULTISPECIES: hypothetical protein [Comamonas]MCD2167605.1 hypothetical protein [Comamonas koreensis]ULR88435.1 hypothetical protein MJ205_18660 [Comamonas sp. B21-038]